MRTFILAASAALVFLSGCATNPDTGERELTEGGKAALKEVAAIGVSRYFRENPGATAKAERIRSVLTELQQIEQFTTVAALKLAVQSRIDKLDDPYDREDFTRLNNLLAPLLAESVGAGELAPGAVIEVKEWLAYIASALPRPAGS